MKLEVVTVSKTRGRDGKVIRQLGCSLVIEGQAIDVSSNRVQLLITDRTEGSDLAGKDVGDIIEVT